MFYGEYKVQKGLYLLLFWGCFTFIMNILFVLDTLQIIQKETLNTSNFVLIKDEDSLDFNE